jgi:hypothetical protein
MADCKAADFRRLIASVTVVGASGIRRNDETGLNVRGYVGCDRLGVTDGSENRGNIDCASETFESCNRRAILCMLPNGGISCKQEGQSDLPVS